MKVIDLIEKLKYSPPDSPIVLSGYEGGFADVVCVKEITLTLNAHQEWFYGRHEKTAPHESNAVNAVVIVGEQRKEL
ncbi:hypothetical protein J7L67_05965 [bacterium]|nr:hypothetical protein [bacterium]